MSKNKKIIIFILVICLVLVTLASFLLLSILRSPVGPPDPAISTHATDCMIKKDDRDIFTITGCHDVQGITPEVAGFYVAKSNEDLTKYIGKKIHIEADYLANSSNTDSIKTNLQCIQNICKQIFLDKNQTTYAVVIKQISEID